MHTLTDSASDDERGSDVRTTHGEHESQSWPGAHMSIVRLTRHRGRERHGTQTKDPVSSPDHVPPQTYLANSFIDNVFSRLMLLLSRTWRCSSWTLLFLAAIALQWSPYASRAHCSPLQCNCPFSRSAAEVLPLSAVLRGHRQLLCTASISVYGIQRTPPRAPWSLLATPLDDLLTHGCPVNKLSRTALDTGMTVREVIHR